MDMDFYWCCCPTHDPSYRVDFGLRPQGTGLGAPRRESWHSAVVPSLTVRGSVDCPPQRHQVANQAGDDARIDFHQEYTHAGILLNKTLRLP